ncbi:DNA-directed RNA polymerase I subunit RPA1 [Gossypium hirsutum]|uniref:DNA-directed RNA polymerase I subunit RPA1 n=1 Tax=Gossypium hirsutum TaxID=3635 RepID=A0ABM3A1A7_GOSHI|nr:DNA-directed RNA polymerase I subunit RPA1-like [Gossypium hirsutum]
MDQTGNQKQKQSLMSQFIETQFHRNLTQLLLSVSIFSLFFSHSYCLSLFHSFSFTFHNTLAFKFISHNIDKNFIFLLCNGLLVFLAKFSGLISSSSQQSNLSDDYYNHQSFKSYTYIPQTESTRLDTSTPLLDLEKEENAGFVDEEAKGSSSDEPFVEDNEESETYEPEEEEEEEEEEELMEGNNVLSTEEMNKRFDEFIRKMKEGLRIEAQQQLVMV